MAYWLNKIVPLSSFWRRIIVLILYGYFFDNQIILLVDYGYRKMYSVGYWSLPLLLPIYLVSLCDEYVPWLVIILYMCAHWLFYRFLSCHWRIHLFSRACHWCLYISTRILIGAQLSPCALIGCNFRSQYSGYQDQSGHKGEGSQYLEQLK